MRNERKDKIKDITDNLSSYFDKEELEVGVVLSVLITMTIHAMLKQANIAPHDAIKIFADAVCLHVDKEKEDEDEDEEDNEGEIKWLN